MVVVKNKQEKMGETEKFVNFLALEVNFPIKPSNLTKEVDG